MGDLGGPGLAIDLPRGPGARAHRRHQGRPSHRLPPVENVRQPATGARVGIDASWLWGFQPMYDVPAADVNGRPEDGPPFQVIYTVDGGRTRWVPDLLIDGPDPFGALQASGARPFTPATAPPSWSGGIPGSSHRAPCHRESRRLAAAQGHPTVLGAPRHSLRRTSGSWPTPFANWSSTHRRRKHRDFAGFTGCS